MADAGAYNPEEQKLIEQQMRTQKQGDAAWKHVLAQNRGGHVGAGGYTSNFEAAGDVQALVDMVENASPGRISQVAETYGRIHQQISDITKELHTHVNNMLEHWTGPAADGFREHATNLHTSMTNSLNYAKNAQNALKASSESLSRAQSNIHHQPGFWDKAGTFFTTDETTKSEFRIAAEKEGLAKAMQTDGTKLSASDQAFQHNVLVMQNLGTDYNNNTALLNQSPGRPPSGGYGTWPTPVNEQPGHVTQPSDSTPDSPNGTSGGGGTAGGGHYTGAGSGGISGGIAQPHVNGLPSTTGIDGVSGGHGDFTGAVNPTGTGGVNPGGSGGNTVTGGFGGVPSVSGLAAGGLAGRSRFGAGAGFAEEAGLGKGGAALEGKGGAALEGEGELAGERAFTKGGSGIGGAAEGEGMGNRGMMGGGMGGMGRGGGRKKGRKGRADYLVEDEDTWMQDDVPNPPVIG
jgi:WXG100 family type VII secretion target